MISFFMNKEYCVRHGHNFDEAVFWWITSKVEFTQEKSLIITVETKPNGSKESDSSVEHILNNKQFIDSVEIYVPNININLYFKASEENIVMKIYHNETHYTFTFCLEVI